MSFSKNPVRRMDFTISLRPYHGMEYNGETEVYPCPHPIEESVENIRHFLDREADMYVFQVEDTRQEYSDDPIGNMHIQGRLHVSRRIRTKAMFDKLVKYLDEIEYWPIKIEHIRISPTSNPTRNFDYVLKEKTRVSGPYSDRDYTLHVVEDPLKGKTKYLWQDLALKWLSPEGRSLYNSSSRRILFITDPVGASGKSTLVKHLMLTSKDILVLPSCGTPTQMSNALAECGPYAGYVLDLPRVKPKPETIGELMYTIEMLSNGMICSSMYGKYRSLVMNSPQICVFSNYSLSKYLSADRYVTIDPRSCQGDELDKIQNIPCHPIP